MNLKWFLGLSVLLNVALVVAMQWMSPAPTKPPAPIPAPSVGLSRPARVSTGDAPLHRGETIGRKKIKSSAAEPTLEVDDYPTFVRKLRAAGLSEDTIATLIVSEIHDRSIDDYIALQRKLNHGEITQEEMQRQQRQLQKDQETTLETLLGQDGYRQYQLKHDYQLRQLTASGRFSPDQLSRYFDLRQANQDAMRDLQDQFNAQGIPSLEYQDQLQALQKSYQDNLVKTLGADVADGIRLETDWQIQNLRRQLTTVQISDSEFAQLGRILQNFQQDQQKISSQQRHGDLAQQDASTQFQALEQQRKDQLAALLGPQRYAEYEKQQDGAFQRTRQWGKPNGLNDEQVDYVYQVVKTWRQQQQDLYKMRSDPQFKKADFTATMDQLNSDTRNTLQRYLGAERYTRFKNATGQGP